MLELFHESIKVVNLPYTILFGAMLTYWSLYVVGALGSDFLDFMELDMGGGDGDLDVDVDASGGALASVMRFVHGGDVPMTIILSTQSISMWVLSILANYYLENDSVPVAFGLFFPIFLISLIVTSFSLAPLVPILKRAFDETGDRIEVIGQICVVSSLEVTPKYGQAEISRQGSPLAINVKTKEGETLTKGDEAVVFARDDNDETYVVTKYT